MSTLRSFRRGRGRKYWFMGATAIAVAVFAVIFVASSGAVIAPSTFEGNDGNMVVDAAGHTDWVTLTGNPNLQSLVDRPSGSGDNSFGQGTKENDTNVTVVPGTIPPNKNDLTRSYIYNDQFNGNSFLYLAWERAANSGDAHIDFELNQNATTGFNDSTFGKVTLNRTQGDLLISYDFGGSGTPIITLFTWSGSAWTNPQDLSLLGFAEAAVNTSAINDVLNPSQPAPVGVGDFGEASVNLSDALLAAGFNPNTCQAFGSLTVKARSSGASTSAELKDFIAPVPVHASNCLTPTIATQTTFPTMNVGETETVGDTATLTSDPTPTGDVSFQLYSDASCTTKVAGVSGMATLDNGVATFSGASFTPTQAGTYVWGVSYPGDNHNNAASACGGLNEKIVVNAANVSITKTADDSSPVNAGDPIGFTVEVKNTGLGDATGVTLNDLLPAGSGTGVTWSIDSSVGTPAQFVLGGSAGSQTLGLASSTLLANADYTVHIVASTSATECGVYDNTATLTTGNANNPDPASAEEDCLKPGLSVFKTADNPLVNAGDPIGFKITVGNGNGGTATNVTLSDPLPQGTGEIVWSIDNQPAGTPCSLDSTTTNPQTLSCSFGDLAANTSVAVHVTATTSFTECTTYNNTATASADNAPDAQASASIECRTPALSVTKMADVPTVNAGDPLGFTIAINNSSAAGTGTAKNVTLSDPLPAGTASDWSISPAYSGPGSCSITGPSGSQELDCSFGDMAPGDSASVHVSSSTSFVACTTYDNTATASADNEPGVPPASASITCERPSLSVTKAADAVSVNAGDPIGFTINVSNSAAEGTGTAKNVTLSDPLPAGTASDWVISPAYSGPGSCSITGPSGSQELDCSFGDLASDNSVTVHVSSSTSFAACTTYDNTATASAGNAPGQDASASIACTSPQVVITKTADHSAPVNAGSQIGFTVEIKNTGAGDATGVTLSDPLPAGSGSGVTWAVDTSAGTPAQFALSGAKGSQVLSLASSTLPAGADYKAHIVASTSQTECGTYNNTATLTTGNANNPNPASASESCGFHVDLSVTKAGSPATQTLGDGNITWTIVVTNHGPDTDTGVTIADPMPAGNTFVSATTTQGTCTGGAILNCTIGTMASGATVTITLVTTPSTVGAQTNTVNVAGSRPETNTANNAASATVQTVGVITPPVFCVAVSKVTPNQLFVGRKTGLTIHLTQNKKAVKGVHVLIKGPKLNIRTGASNAKGIVKQTVKMKKAGIVIFTPIASKRCNTKRVGVTNVFTPPVTG